LSLKFCPLRSSSISFRLLSPANFFFSLSRTFPSLVFGASLSLCRRRPLVCQPFFLDLLYSYDTSIFSHLNCFTSHSPNRFLSCFTAQIAFCIMQTNQGFLE